MDFFWHFIEIATRFPMDFHWYFIEISTGFPVDFHWYFIDPMPIMQPSWILACFAYLALWYYPWDYADSTNANCAVIMDIHMFCIFGIVRSANNDW